MAPQRSQVVALWVWYRGERFRGFQIQVEGPTVQGELARALALLGADAVPNPSGRTDLGVHARMQVCSLRVPLQLPPAELEARLPALLPEGVGLCAARLPPTRFHAQWSATGKEYRYRLCLGSVPPGWEGACWEVGSHPRLAGRTVEVDRLRGLLERAQGTFDFIAFHGKSSVRKPRTISAITVRPYGSAEGAGATGGGLFEVVIRGEGFARHQVRFLVGSAVLAAAGVLPERDFDDALARGTAIEGLRAPASGLVLWEVGYPAGADPFTAAERRQPPGVPRVPPFLD